MLPAIKRWTKTFRRRIQPKHVKTALAGTFALAGLLFMISFFWPRTVAFSYAQETCFANPVLFPPDASRTDGSAFAATPVTSWSVFGYKLYSRTTCLEATGPPPAGASETLKLKSGWWILSQRVSVKTDQPPEPELTGNTEFVSIRDPLAFQLNSADTVFNYRLSVHDKSVICANLDRQLRCNLERLGLKQSELYDFKLTRTFDDRPLEEVFSRPLTTVEPVRITNTSVKPGGVMFDKSQTLTITADKPLASAQGVKLELIAGDKTEEIPLEIAVKDRVLAVTLPSPIKRQASYRLSITDLTAVDKGFLTKPYRLDFKTSGGPKVAGTNTGSYGVSTLHDPVLSFDYDVSAKQKLAEHVWLEISGRKVAARVTAAGRSVTIIPTDALPRCTGFILKVSDSLENKHGVAGGSAWEFHSRTICQTTQIIGTSAQGRAITAYRFGGGPSRVVFVGGTHGDEPSSAYTLNSFIDNLEQNFHDIPKNRTIIVVPGLNPDGLAAGRRTNARNVDLNRNFPANKWKKDVVMPGGSTLQNGGGSAPLSEPESKAVAGFVLAQNPALVLTYHAVGSLAIANESGNSMTLTTRYANLSGFRAMRNSQIGGTFSHDTTGAFEDWLHDKYGIPAILVELSTYTGNEFWSQREAMWSMVRF